MPSKLPKILHYLGLLLFFASLALPAFHSDKGELPGWGALIIGWFPTAFGVFTGAHNSSEWLGTLAWFANPLLMLAWLFMAMRKRWAGLVLALATVGTGCLIFQLKTVIVPENGTLNQVVPEMGCFVWLAAMAVAVLSALCSLLVKPAQSSPLPAQERLEPTGLSVLPVGTE